MGAVRKENGLSDAEVDNTLEYETEFDDDEQIHI